MFNPTINLELDHLNIGAFNLYDGPRKLGTMQLNIDDGKLMIFHTEVDPDSRGKGYARQLFDAMVAYAREHELKVVPLCPYVRKQFKKSPDEYNDIRKK